MELPYMKELGVTTLQRDQKGYSFKSLAFFTKQKQTTSGFNDVIAGQQFFMTDGSSFSQQPPFSLIRCQTSGTSGLF